LESVRVLVRPVVWELSFRSRVSVPVVSFQLSSPSHLEPICSSLSMMWFYVHGEVEARVFSQEFLLSSRRAISPFPPHLSWLWGSRPLHLVLNRLSHSKQVPWHVLKEAGSTGPTEGGCSLWEGLEHYLQYPFAHHPLYPYPCSFWNPLSSLREPSILQDVGTYKRFSS